MARPSKYSADFRARAMRLVEEARPEYDTEWAAITSVAHKLGVSSETLRKWIRQAQVDQGQRPGATTDESAELKRLRRGNAVPSHCTSGSHRWPSAIGGAREDLDTRMSSA